MTNGISLAGVGEGTWPVVSASVKSRLGGNADDGREGTRITDERERESRARGNADDGREGTRITRVTRIRHFVPAGEPGSMRQCRLRDKKNSLRHAGIGPASGQNLL